MDNKINLRAGRPSNKANKETTLSSFVEKAETVRVTFDLYRHQYRKLKLHAARHDKTIREILSEYVDLLDE